MRNGKPPIDWVPQPKTRPRRASRARQSSISLRRPRRDGRTMPPVHSSGENRHQDERHEDQPASPARGTRGITHRQRSSTDRSCGSGGLHKRPIAAFPSHPARRPAVGRRTSRFSARSDSCSNCGPGRCGASAGSARCAAQQPGPDRPVRHGPRSRTCHRRPLGVRLWLADVAARLRFPRARRGPPDRRPPGAVRLFVRSPRHARAARPRARSRPRRRLPRHRVSGGGRRPGQDRSPICARASRRPASIANACAAVWLKGEPARQVPALCYVVDRSHVQYAGRLPLAEQLHYVRQGHGQSGPNRDYVIATVAAMEALGLRESELHLLARAAQGNARRRRADVTRRRHRAPALALLDQPRGGGLDHLLQALEKDLLVEPGRDRIEKLDHDRAGVAAERAARPEQAGIERDRQARDPALGVQMHDAVFVARLGAGRPARAFRKDDDLAVARELDRGAGARWRRAPANARRDRPGSSRPSRRTSRRTAATSARA